MAKLDSINEESIQQIDTTLSCIASSARTIKVLSGQILECRGVGNEAGALADALEQVASYIGYMADEGLRRIGSPGCIGGAEEWILPPTLRRAEQQIEEIPHTA